jgi:hypothetical protein
MMTDQQIRSHLVSGVAKSSGGDGVSFIGDMIVGAKEEKKKKKRKSGPRFAWEEDEDEGDANQCPETSHRITAAPTLMDIMDEKDEVDLMSPVKVNKAFNSLNAEPSRSTAISKKRYRNEALDHLAIFTDTATASTPSDGNASIGWNLLRVLGYRSRLGVALVPLNGFDKSDKCLVESLDKNATHWLASKKLRAIHLPSIQSNNQGDGGEAKSAVVDVGVDKKATVLVIPPPKINKHGLGYDPFKNAPEFRAFHEHRQRMAQKQGREDGGGTADKKRQHRYLTDDLRQGARRPWEDATNNNERDDFDEESDGNQHDADIKYQHSHYAAERNYEHLIGSKASSGFALEDEDDANVYDGGDHNFPQLNKQRHDGDYALEVQSPVASDEEDMGHESSLFDGLGSRKSKPSVNNFNSSGDQGENIADAWSAWGFGTGSAAGHTATAKPLTQDGKPPLQGFILSRKVLPGVRSITENANNRWEGPKVPSDYVLKRHVFAKEDNSDQSSVNGLDRNDYGLGLDLQARQSQNKPPRRQMPIQILPSSDTSKKAPEKLLAKDGTALSFHAVRESMKNRFVSSTSTTQDSFQETAPNVIENKDKRSEEWIDVTISTWMPARLLCKRWGVPIPTDDYGGAADSTVNTKRTGEEEYFQNTIFDLTVAKRRDQHASSETPSKQQTVTAGSKPAAFDEVNDELFESDDRAAPTRPSETIFRSIFDVESDMEMSSDDDEPSGETNTDKADILQHSIEANEFDVHGRARMKRQKMLARQDEENTERNPKDTTADMPLSSIYSLASNDSSSSYDEQKRKHKHKSHRRYDSDSSSDASKRKRHKHKHRSRHKEKKGRKEKWR